MGKYKLFLLLMIFLCISCGNNIISLLSRLEIIGPEKARI